MAKITVEIIGQFPLVGKDKEQTTADIIKAIGDACWPQFAVMNINTKIEE